MSKMADFSHQENHDDYLRKMEVENKKLKEQVSTLERTNNHLNKLLSDVKSLLETFGVQDGPTLKNTSNASVTGCQSAIGLVVSDSSKREQDQKLAPGTDHTHSPRKCPEVETAVNSGGKCEPLVFTTLPLPWSELRKKELKNSQDERRLRHFLCKAITAHASLLASEGFGLQASDFPDRLVSRGCITEEECSKFLNSSNKPINLMRVILGLVIRRDCNTLLSFIEILFQYNEYLAKEITQTYDSFMSGHDDLSQVQDLDCSHCLLRERVEPVLIIDRLIGRNYRKWLPFYEQVTRWDNVPEKRAFLWDTFMAQVNNEGVFAEIMPDTIEALEACGFHSDIVNSLHEDQRTGINSFICRHISLPEETLKYSNDVKTKVSEPKMHEIKLNDIADDNNTRLKEKFCPMIQNVSNESVENKMQELKSFESESMPSVGHTEDEQTNNGTQNGNANSSCTIHVLLVTDSNIKISKREDR
ncbi:uncharacterized protein LOC123529914 [Mercenaria mercenaria]|uniref:uncharacterized protein LOC123529914 n=1 Tax=Mercenaria mercenaria TaxID=6596 RepID=UPI00234F7A6B|nr:uncharacterized protein LOC123529914 [Mercenaria mercenaria]